MERAEDLNTATELFRPIDDPVDSFRSGYPFFNPDSAPRRREATDDHTTGLNDRFGVAFDGSDEAALDATFRATLKETRLALENQIKRLVWQHPLYNFVQAVNGAMGISMSDATASFNTTAVQQDVNLIVAKLERVRSLERQKDKEKSTTETIETRARNFQDKLQRARSELDSWQGQINADIALMLRFWNQVEGDIREEGRWRQGFAELLQVPENSADSLMDLFLAGSLGENTKSKARFNKVLDDLAFDPESPDAEILQEVTKRELYPLVVGRWSMQTLYNANPPGNVDFFENEYLREWLVAKDVLGAPPSQQQQQPPPPPPPQMPRAPQQVKQISLQDPLNYVTEEESSVEIVQKSSAVTTQETNWDLEKLKETITSIRQAWEEDGTGNGIFSNTSERAAYAFIFIPVQIAIDALGYLLRGEHGGMNDFSSSTKMETEVSIQVAIEYLEKPDSPSTSLDIASALKGFQEILLPEQNSATLPAGEPQQQLSPALKFVQKTILDRGNVGVLGDTERGADFWTYIDDTGNRKTKLLQKWKKLIGDLIVEPLPEQTVETLAAVVVATLLYRDYFVSRYTKIRASLNQIQRLRGEEQKKRRDLLRLGDRLSSAEQEVERERSQIQNLQAHLLDPDSVGPNNDIVQAMNYAFMLVKQSIPSYRDLKYAENIALANNEEVVTAFAQMVATVRRKNQISGPAVGYVQNVHYGRTKIEMSGAVALLQNYRPEWSMGDDRSGYRFSSVTPYY